MLKIAQADVVFSTNYNRTEAVWSVLSKEDPLVNSDPKCHESFDAGMGAKASDNEVIIMRAFRKMDGYNDLISIGFYFLHMNT